MKEIKNNYSFLTVGKINDTDATSRDFKRYVGYASSYIKGFNPTKEESDAFMGFESSFEPEYTKEEDGVKVANIHFLVETDPDLCGGIDLKQKAMFTLRLRPALSSDGTTVQVIDDFGNYAKMNYEDAKAHKPLPGDRKIDQTRYRIACDGEVDLTVFLKKLLGISNSLDYKNGVWVVKDGARDSETGSMFRLDNIKDYFNGDFSEIQKALAMNPKGKIKLLYGVKTKEDGKQIQTVCTNADIVLRNNHTKTEFTKAAENLSYKKEHGKWANIEYVAQPLAEYDVQPTAFSAAPASSDSSTGDMPWD